ncbi:hypothetical protein HAV2_gp14 [Hyperthermophilic Archaeal Virus 2]|uniref:hypothetical protein n=1 Tax=Hyperthermophilic Archaeal Virus 2 TaxID=762906 RepID=UPI0001DBAE21|nr:hypothetical protein HAV2_gp14 [Hyperthermophilic Archaeal Virus 2]ADJ54277.1 hypothetical protein HAV2_gp14 [Hyperthermophilic Archaeal Virus 2]
MSEGSVAPRGVSEVLRALEAGLTPKRYASNLLTRTLPPPVSDAYLIASLAMSVFDEMIPLKTRFVLLSTAVRLLANSSITVSGDALGKAGLCGLLYSSAGVDACYEGDVREHLVEIINNYEHGRKPISAQALRIIAEAVLVLISSELRRIRDLILNVNPEGAEVRGEGKRGWR